MASVASSGGGSKGTPRGRTGTPSTSSVASSKTKQGPPPGLVTTKSLAGDELELGLVPHDCVCVCFAE